MAMTAAQIEAELQRKAKLGIAPTSSANTQRYNQIKTNIQNQVKQPVQTTPTAQPTQQPFKLAQGQEYVRNALESAGMKDINYDKARNMVTSGGVDVLQPDKIVNGSSIASGDALKSAIAKYQQSENQRKQQELFSRLETMLGSAPQAKEFSYDAEADPVYQAALRRAQANATTATGNAMAEMNRRGLLNSTMMGDRAAQIQQGEYGRVSDEILPQLIQQAYGRYRDNYNDQYQQYRDQVGDTGNLLSTANQMGQQAWQNALTDKQSNLNAALQVGEQTGMLVTPQSDWSGLFRQVANGTNSQGAPLGMNLAGQQFQSNEAQRQFENNVTMAGLTGTLPNGQKTTAEQQRELSNWWMVAQQTGVIPNNLADMYGIKRGTRTQDAIAQAENIAQGWAANAISQQNANTSAYSANTSRMNATNSNLMDIWRATGKAPAGIDGVPVGTPYAPDVETPKAAEYNYRTDPDFMADAAAMVKSPGEARTALRNNAEAYIDKYGIEGYNYLITTVNK